MTQATDVTDVTDASDVTQPAETESVAYGGRAVVAAAASVRGVTAAGLGLGALTVLVVMAWISSPYPDSGPGGAFHVAASLWLLAHGVELVRTDTLSGQPAPVGVVPLLLVALPVWLVHRAARDSAERGQRDGLRNGLDVWCAVTAGYLTVGAAATAYAAGGPLGGDVLSAVLHLPPLAAASAAAGIWTARGRPLGPLPGWTPERVRVALARTRAVVALRAACAGALTLVIGGAVLAVTSLGWHWGMAQESLFRLSEVWSGRAAVVLLMLALTPNAAVWGAAYGLGPGFGVGAGAAVTPFGAGGTRAGGTVADASVAVPYFPWLAAAPETGGGATPLTWAATVVPVAAGGVVAWLTVRGRGPAGPPPAGWRDTALTALLGAAGCALLTAFLAAASGGPLGTGRLAAFGPVWWLTGAAALAWCGGIGVAGALGVWGWRRWRALREARRGSSGVRGASVGREQGPEETAEQRAEPSGPVEPVEPFEAPESAEPSGASAPSGAALSETYDFLPADPWADRGDLGEPRTEPSGSSGGDSPQPLPLRPGAWGDPHFP
ncbi:DUF6350 family protein [Streptomyces sp. PR69]|uniref:cell division protein PerM n=1 Tax=Streptomyces sp. PR69 TaxID=2984950 RepID=UPI0022643C96|nr:DUF6350 family protein [Streptomyces sp. PR69]